MVTPTKPEQVVKDGNTSITLPPISSFDSLIKAAAEQGLQDPSLGRTKTNSATATAVVAVSTAGRQKEVSSEGLLACQISNFESHQQSLSSPSYNNTFFLPYRQAALEKEKFSDAVTGISLSKAEDDAATTIVVAAATSSACANESMVNRVGKHSKPRKKKECSICHNFYANLSTHMSTHLDPNARPHKCEVCHRGFARSNDLQRHKKRHWKDEFSPGYVEPPHNHSAKDQHEVRTHVAPSEIELQSLAQRHGLATKFNTDNSAEHLRSLHMIQGTYKCPFNSTLIKLDMEIYPTKDRKLPFETSNCHISGVFSRCDTYKNHLKALHFEYPPGTKKRERANIHGCCKHCGMKFDNVDMWLNEHVGKICGYFYH